MKYFILTLSIFASYSLYGDEIEIIAHASPKQSEISVHLHLPKTADEISWGLMNVRALKQDEGMLFIFPKKKKLNFWMFNCYVDLDIAFLDNSLIIREIKELIADPEMIDLTRPIYSLADIHKLYPPNDPILQFFYKKSVLSKGSFRYAIELPYHFLSTNNISMGWYLSHKEGGDTYLIAPMDFTDNQSIYCQVSKKSKSISYLVSNNTDGYVLYELSDKNRVLKQHDFSNSTSISDKFISHSFEKEALTSTVLYTPKKPNLKQDILRVGDYVKLKGDFS